MEGIVEEHLGIVEAAYALCFWLFLGRLHGSRGLAVTKAAVGQPVRKLRYDNGVQKPKRACSRDGQEQVVEIFIQWRKPSRYLLLDGFDVLSGCTFGCGLPGSGVGGTVLSASPGSCFMILLPGGGSLFEITSSPLGVW